MNSSEMLPYYLTRSLGDSARSALPDAPVIEDEPDSARTSGKRFKSLKARTATALHLIAWRIEPDPNGTD